MKLKRNQLKMKLLQVENVNLLLVHLFSWFLGVSVVKITGFSILGGRGSPRPPPPVKQLVIPPARKNPRSRLSPPNFYSLLPKVQTNNNFHE